MPLNLDTRISINKQVDVLEIDSFTVDLARSEIIVGYAQYAKGEAVNQSVLVIDGLDYAASIGRANELANAMPSGQVNVYGAIKVALYEYMTKATGQAGTVA